MQTQEHTLAVLLTLLTSLPQDYKVSQLEIGYSTGEDRVLLWLPVVINHIIDDNSPLAKWKDNVEAILQDSDTTIVVVVS